MDIFSLPIVEVGLSIIISWALFAIFCSMIHETMVQIKGERGRFFKKYMLRQFDDKPNKINWGSMLYTHPSVELLSREYNKPASEITAKIFSEAMFEIIPKFQKVRAAKKSPPADYVAKYANPQLADFALAMHILRPSNTIAMLKSALHKAEVRAQATGASNEGLVYNYLIEEISLWYGQFCERTTVWYSKATKTRLFFVGFLVSIACNVDSIRLFKYYNDNPNARKTMIEYYQKNQAQLEQLAQQYDIKNTKMNVAAPNDTTSAAQQKADQLRNVILRDSTKLDSIKADITLFRTAIDSLAKANKIPIGWSCEDKPVKNANEQASEATPPIEKLAYFLLCLFGYAISAFAASLGAPFWFDILRKANPIKSKTT